MKEKDKKIIEIDVTDFNCDSFKDWEMIDFNGIKQMAVDLAEFENRTVKDAFEYITQTGEHSNLGKYTDLIGLVYSREYLIKKIGIKYWLFFWKRKLYLQKQVYNEIHSEDV